MKNKDNNYKKQCMPDDVFISRAQKRKSIILSVKVSPIELKLIQNKWGIVNVSKFIREAALEMAVQK